MWPLDFMESSSEPDYWRFDLFVGFPGMFWRFSCVFMYLFFSLCFTLPFTLSNVTIAFLIH